MDAHPPAPLALLDNVTVLFADVVRFTERASLVAPHELVVALDDVFTRFDEVADRFGMEKIKTVGDARTWPSPTRRIRSSITPPPLPRWPWRSSTARPARFLVGRADGAA